MLTVTYLAFRLFEPAVPPTRDAHATSFIPHLLSTGGAGAVVEGLR
jgi:hypothetical protein